MIIIILVLILIAIIFPELLLMIIALAVELFAWGILIAIIATSIFLIQ